MGNTSAIVSKKNDWYDPCHPIPGVVANAADERRIE